MAVHVLTNRPFARWARQEELADVALCDAAMEIDNGLAEARLGGFLVKKRIGKEGRGKSAGLRVIAAHREGTVLFLFGFAKRERSNINQAERAALRKLGDIYIAMANAQLRELIRQRILFEVTCD